MRKITKTPVDFFLVVSNSKVEEILDIRNVHKALKSVEANDGAGGVDGMRTEELRPYLKVHWHKLRESILNGSYRPSPVRKVEIPKAGGGKRMLGVPTVIDRLLQQCVAQWLSPKYEEEFSMYSYGFRPNRNAHQAVVQAQVFFAGRKNMDSRVRLRKILR